MNVVHVVGRKNQGKTTLVCDLIQEFGSRGLKVGSVKHTHHRHELDIPGKDSYRHRQAGANPVAIVTPGLSAVFLTVPSSGADRYQVLAPWMNHCDLVLVEGDLTAQGPKIEVWRAALGLAPLVETDPTIAAVVTDDECSVVVPVLARRNTRQLGDWILQLVGRGLS